MRPMVLTPEIREHIAKMVKYAFENSIGYAQMKSRCDNPKAYEPLGNDPNRTIEIPMGYRATFTVEEQGGPLGWVRHLSVSIDLRDTGKPLPSLHAVNQLMVEFGFNPLNEKADVVFIEDMAGGPCDGKKAVNILQTITPANPNVQLRTHNQPTA
jgi:hypothetical protein